MGAPLRHVQMALMSIGTCWPVGPWVHIGPLLHEAYRDIMGSYWLAVDNAAPGDPIWRHRKRLA